MSGLNRRLDHSQFDRLVIVTQFHCDSMSTRYEPIQIGVGDFVYHQLDHVREKLLTCLFPFFLPLLFAAVSVHKIFVCFPGHQFHCVFCAAKHDWFVCSSEIRKASSPRVLIWYHTVYGYGSDPSPICCQCSDVSMLQLGRSMRQSGTRSCARS